MVVGVGAEASGVALISDAILLLFNGDASTAPNVNDNSVEVVRALGFCRGFLQLVRLSKYFKELCSVPKPSRLRL